MIISGICNPVSYWTENIKSNVVFCTWCLSLHVFYELEQVATALSSLAKLSGEMKGL